MASSEMLWHQKLGDVFLEVRELDFESRAAYLRRLGSTDPEMSSWVERMLAADAGSRPILDDTQGALRLGLAQPSLVGARIGTYSVQRLLGAGGMGAVYEALQDQPRRSVALKMMQLAFPSASARRRFGYETEVLGRLRHPGIAQIYEAGVHEDHGRASPYFVMELVPGARTIAAYVKEQRLTSRQIVELFLLVCDAVHHGHQRGVIHRDLKPENILVDEAGQPKVIDFGVARAVHRDAAVGTLQTQVGQLIGTVAYMSPEQVAGDGPDVDVRTDVYSLAVVLFELLTGQLPYAAPSRSVSDMLEAIRKGATRHLRAVDPRLSGDLDTVLGKALQLDHERRYSSAAEMRADLQRWLRDEPIIARPPSVPYQIRKFAKRNKALVGGIVGIFLVLVAGLAAERARRLQALAAEHRAQAAQAKVEVEAQRSQRVIQFLNDMLQSVTPDQANGQEVTVRQVLDEVATGLDEELQDSPEVDATVRYILGETYEQLGAYREAVAMLKAAAAIHERLGIATEETAHIHHSLGSCHVHLKELDDALTEYGVALSLAEKLLGPESDAFLQILNDRGQVYYERNDLEEVAATLRQVIAIRERAFGESDQDLHIVRVNLAMVLQQQGKRPEARDLLRNAFNWLVEHNGPTQSSTLGVMERLAGAEYELGNTAEADRLSLEMIALFREHFGPDHPELALALLSYGSRLQNTYREAEAEEALRESLRIREVAFGPNHVDTAAVLGRLGAAVAEQDRLDEGLALQERALQIYRSAVEARDVPLAWALHGYAAILSKAERYNDALAASEEAIDLLAKAYGGEAPQTLIAKARMAMTELTMGKRLEALALHEEILRERQRQLQENHPDITMAMCNLASNQLELNRFQEARELFDDVVPRFRVELGEQAVNYCMALTRAALTAFYDGDADAAIASATSALGCPEFQRKSDARLGVLARAIVAQAHLHRDELAEAQTVFAEMQPPPATLMQETRWESGYALLVDAKLLQAAGADPVPTATRAYEILNRKFGPEHLFTRTAAELAQP